MVSCSITLIQLGTFGQTYTHCDSFEADYRLTHTNLSLSNFDSFDAPNEKPEFAPPYRQQIISRRGDVAIAVEMHTRVVRKPRGLQIVGLGCILYSLG